MTCPTCVSHRSNLRQKEYRKRHRRRQRIFERDGYMCVFCGSTEDLTIDHKVPQVRGGSNADNNLQTACRRCNKKKGSGLHPWERRGESPVL